MKGKDVGYKRVSTLYQNPERQLEGLKLDKVFVEYASGGSMKRPILQQLIEYVRDDDTVYVHSMDRLARNLKDLRHFIDEMVVKRVKVVFMKENLTFSGERSPMSDLLLSLIGSVAEFELAIIRERQAEGVAIAKKKGKYKGRKKCFDQESLQKLKECIGTKSKSMAQVARDFGVSHTTFYKYKKLLNTTDTVNG